MIRVPIYLAKRMADGPGGDIRFQIEVPEEHIDLAHKMEKFKGQFFVAVGPCDEDKLREFMKAD